MLLVLISVMGGVKLEFIQNSFDSIRRFEIRLIRKAKNSKNLIKINSKFVQFDTMCFLHFYHSAKMVNLMGRGSFEVI